MIVSDAYEFIMLTPWKSASQTLHARLADIDNSRYDRFFHFSDRLGRVVHQHLTLGDFIGLPESRLGYKTATFVRNPYDRAYSGFIQLQRDFESQPRHELSPRWVSDLVRVQISDNMARIIKAGFDFDDWIRDLPEYEILEAGRNTSMPLHPAHYWTIMSGVSVDFVGKVENFDSDFAKFCDFVGITSSNADIENVSESSNHAYLRYSRYAGRMSRRSLDRINDIFSMDFELFGYEKL